MSKKNLIQWFPPLGWHHDDGSGTPQQLWHTSFALWHRQLSRMSRPQEWFTAAGKLVQILFSEHQSKQVQDFLLVCLVDLLVTKQNTIHSYTHEWAAVAEQTGLTCSRALWSMNSCCFFMFASKDLDSRNPMVALLKLEKTNKLKNRSINNIEDFTGFHKHKVHMQIQQSFLKSKVTNKKGLKRSTDCDAKVFMTITTRDFRHFTFYEFWIDLWNILYLFHD